MLEFGVDGRVFENVVEEGREADGTVKIGVSVNF